MNAAVSVVIVNWNAGDLLRACVHSVMTACNTQGLVEIIIVDNGSTDSSALALQGTPGVTVVRNETNEGFARACNQGAAAAGGRYLLFLNPDCELRGDAITPCIRELESGDLSLAAVTVRLVDEQNHTWRSCQRFPDFVTLLSILSGAGRAIPWLPRDHFMSEWAHDCDRDVDNIIGAFYFIRRDVFERLGGFDERFFVYWEDVDLSRRVHDAGMRIRFLSEPTVFHLGGGTTDKVKALRMFFTTRSRVLYAFKHLPRWQAWCHALLTATLEPAVRLAERAVRGKWADAREVLRAFGMFYRDIPGMARTARAR